MEKRRTVPFAKPDMSELEIQEVAETLRSGWITTGVKTKRLERELAAYLGIKNCVCLSSATAAEEMNLRILGIGPGDEILVPAYTYTATASACIHVGATVRFIDCQKDSFEMDYDAMEEAINERTKAVIPVDLGGIICDYDRILQAVERKRALFVPGGNTELGRKIQKAMGRIAIVSDCAHALGASKDGVKAGAIADFSSFSFHAVKNFTTGEGGASTWKSIPGVSDQDIYYMFQLLSLHGQSRDSLEKSKTGSWEYDIIMPLYKCNMTDIMAGIGLGQLKRYDGMLKRRRGIIARYDAMSDEMGLLHLKHYTADMSSSGHLYIVRIPWADDQLRRQIITEMSDLGVACNVHYKPLPMMTAYKKCSLVNGGGVKIEDFPNAFHYYENEITLPLHTMLSDEDVDYVIECFKEALSKTRSVD